MNKNNNDNLIYVAKLGKTIGLKGGIKIHIESDFPEQFRKNGKFIIDNNKQLIIEEYNSNNSTIKFHNINTLENAKILTNKLLYTTIKHSREKCIFKDKEFFWFDLIGCKINENSNILGTIKEIHRYPLGDYLEVNTNISLIKTDLPKIFLIPYLDEYIRKVDIENKVIYTINTFSILENS